MMKFKSLFKYIFSLCLFFVAFAVFPVNALAAPRLYLDPASFTSTRDTDFQIKLQIDVENQSTFGADAVINYPAGDLTVKSVTNGGFFSDFSFAPSTGKLEIHGFFSSLYSTKSGSGTFAVLTFASNKDQGTGTLNFTCSGGGNDTQILNSEGNNILSCGSLNQTTISYQTTTPEDDGSSGNNNNDNNQVAQPNSCNGTCGSHYNCKAGLFCSGGFCRNPECPASSTCGCTQTSKPKSTTKPVVRPTPQIVTLTEYEATPSSTPLESVTETVAEKGAIDWGTYGIIALLTSLALILISWLIRLIKARKASTL